VLVLRSIRWGGPGLLAAFHLAALAAFTAFRLASFVTVHLAFDFTTKLVDRHSSFAVLRLMTSSTFVDWGTGSSAGFLENLRRIDSELAIMSARLVP
jgi:hypothetical protein